jgi:hypothetical protein
MSKIDAGIYNELEGELIFGYETHKIFTLFMAKYIVLKSSKFSKAI